jgi:hypothetical protein
VHQPKICGQKKKKQKDCRLFAKNSLGNLLEQIHHNLMLIVCVCVFGKSFANSSFILPFR